MQIGFVGLGNVGGKLAASLLRNGFDLMVHDLDESAASELIEQGAQFTESLALMATQCDTLITCLPSPEASADVLEGNDGLLGSITPGTIWMEMSTTDAREVERLGARLATLKCHALDCPVSGGCHRAATGNISIFAGGDRSVFEQCLPVLSVMGRQILHTGELGSASQLKVVTNYLATANLLSLCEALTTCRASGLDLATAYEAIRISSGNSFVHETESQVILNGSRDINFTIDLVLKDIGLFQSLAEDAGVPLELNPLMIKIMQDGAKRFGMREWSPNIIKRLEEASSVSVTADGFPAQMIDNEPEVPGSEVVADRLNHP
ncbi:MAG: NAD(P)-dependent oxidoreductase [Granulosicoccus sp.]|nr:NAD(P)-dependent oxidoreductase [Granulosicoccus sp.]